MGNAWKSVRDGSGHVPEEMLLLYVDGGLNRSDERRIERHLRNCWDCRCLSDEIRRTIVAFVEERQEDVRKRDPGMVSAEMLERRMANMDYPSSEPSIFRWFLRGRAVLWPLATAAALAGIGNLPAVRDYVADLAGPGHHGAPLVTPAAPRPSMPAQIRAAVVHPKRAVSDIPIPEAPAAVRAAISMPTPAELDSAEFAAHAAVHDMGLCRGNMVQILRVPGEAVRITGLAPAARDAESLRSSLAGVKWIDVDLALSDDGVPLEPTQSALRLETRRALLADRLEEVFRRRSPGRAGAAIAEYSGQVVRLSSAAQFEAQALRTLASVFTAERIAGMTADARSRFERMTTEHTAELRQSLMHLGRLIDEIGNGDEGLHAPVAALQEDWQDIVESLERRTARMDYLTAGLFAGLDLEGIEADGGLAELKSVIGESRMLLQAADERRRNLHELRTGR